MLDEEWLKRFMTEEQIKIVRENWDPVAARAEMEARDKKYGFDEVPKITNKQLEELIRNVQIDEEELRQRNASSEPGRNQASENVPKNSGSSGSGTKPVMFNGTDLTTLNKQQFGEFIKNNPDYLASVGIDATKNSPNINTSVIKPEGGFLTQEENLQDSITRLMQRNRNLRGMSQSEANETVINQRGEREKYYNNRKSFLIDKMGITNFSGKTANTSINNVMYKSGTGFDHFIFPGDSAAKSKSESIKGYVSLKDVSAANPEKMFDYLDRLNESGYNGQVKFYDSSAGALLNSDHIVIHGDTQAHIDTAVQHAKDVFGENFFYAEMGKDGTSAINGKRTSYSNLVADDVVKHFQGSAAEIPPTPQESESKPNTTNQSKLKDIKRMLVTNDFENMTEDFLSGLTDEDVHYMRKELHSSVGSSFEEQKTSNYNTEDGRFIQDMHQTQKSALRKFEDYFADQSESVFNDYKDQLIRAGRDNTTHSISEETLKKISRKDVLEAESVARSEADKFRQLGNSSFQEHYEAERKKISSFLEKEYKLFEYQTSRNNIIDNTKHISIGTVPLSHSSGAVPFGVHGTFITGFYDEHGNIQRKESIISYEGNYEEAQKNPAYLEKLEELKQEKNAGYKNVFPSRKELEERAAAQAEPAAQPAEPAAQPAEPAAQPAEPAAQPKPKPSSTPSSTTTTPSSAPSSTTPTSTPSSTPTPTSPTSTPSASSTTSSSPSSTPSSAPSSPSSTPGSSPSSTAAPSSTPSSTPTSTPSSTTAPSSTTTAPSSAPTSTSSTPSSSSSSTPSSTPSSSTPSSTPAPSSPSSTASGPPPSGPPSSGGGGSAAGPSSRTAPGGGGGGGSGPPNKRKPWFTKGPRSVENLFTGRNPAGALKVAGVVGILGFGAYTMFSSNTDSFNSEVQGNMQTDDIRSLPGTQGDYSGYTAQMAGGSRYSNMPVTDNSLGANGNIVFALHKLRNGGA